MKPNDQRNFVHKRIIGAVKGGLTGGVGGAARGFITSGGGRSRRGGGQPLGNTRFTGGPRPCKANERRFADGHCHGAGSGLIQHTREAIAMGALPGGRGFTGPTSNEPRGTALVTMGGPANGTPPMVEMLERRDCGPGMVLSRHDGLCYDRKAIANKDRAWPRGRRPLGTPGELAALSKAAAFGRRMETTVKRMQKIGVLKKPSRQRRFSPPHRKQLAPGPSIINVE